MQCNSWIAKTICILVILSAVQVLILSITSLSLSPDEAHYWEWAKRLDYSYYSKGPVVALLIAASTSIFGDTELAVRLPALLITLITSLIFYAFCSSLVSAQSSFLATVLFRSALFFLLLGMVMTTDPPVILFWLLAMISAYTAIFKHKSYYWLLFGLTCGLAALSKYTALIIYPSLILFLIFTPSERWHLKRLWFWGGVTIFALSFTPVIYWNKQQGWVNFFHNVSHVSPKQQFEIKYVIEILGAQFGLIGLFLFPLLIYLAFIAFREWSKGEKLWGFFLAFSLPLLVVCLLLALTKRVYANWPMPAYLALFAILALAVDRQVVKEKLIKWALFTNIIIGAIVLLIAAGFTLGLPGQMLTTKKLAGWSELGAVASQVYLAQQADFVAVTDYNIGSSLAFYMPQHPTIFCDNVTSRRMHQYDIWQDWLKLEGRDGLLVLRDSTVPQALADKFKQIESLPEKHVTPFAGEDLREFYFFIGKEFSGQGPTNTERY